MKPLSLQECKELLEEVKLPDTEIEALRDSLTALIDQVLDNYLLECNIEGYGA